MSVETDQGTEPRQRARPLIELDPLATAGLERRDKAVVSERDPRKRTFKSGHAFSPAGMSRFRIRQIGLNAVGAQCRRPSDAVDNRSEHPDYPAA
jgi:hypothetical protein